MRRLIPLLFGVILIALAAAGLGRWLVGEEDYTALRVMAPRDRVQTLPVYAQFIVTQRLVLKEAVNVTAVAVPLFVHESQQPLRITLRQEDRELQGWNLRELLPVGASGIVDVLLELAPSRALDGPLEVQFDGSGVTALERDIATKVFIESYDGGYPEGSYRIADNEKKGDVGLEIRARRERWKRVYRGLLERPLEGLRLVGVVALFGLLIGVLPFALLRDVGVKRS